MKNIDIIRLIEIQELKKINPVIKNVIKVLLNSINDWPSSIVILEDYEIDVRNFIGGNVTKNRLEIILSKIDFSQNAWQAESLSHLIEVFQFYDNEVSLKEIIIDLKQKLEDENTNN